MKISIIHPSRGRKEQALHTMEKWLRRIDNIENIEYLFSVDNSDNVKWPDKLEFIKDFINSKELLFNVKVVKNDNHSAIEAINNASKIATGDLLTVISDDFEAPEHWDTLLLKELEGKSDFCAKTDDGLQPTLITMPIMDRIYYERYGYIYHPDYLHLHADEELTCVALMTGKYIKLPLLFPHNHYSTGKVVKDEINVKNDNTWGHGQRTIDRHAKNNFGIENPVMKREDIKWR